MIVTQIEDFNSNDGVPRCVTDSSLMIAISNEFLAFIEHAILVCHEHFIASPDDSGGRHVVVLKFGDTIERDDFNEEHSY